jgi:carbonic anhydrase
VAINAAQAAFDLRQAVETAGKWEIDVLYAVYNTYNHQVGLGVHPRAQHSEDGIRLAHAPSNPREFRDLALQLAEVLKEPAPLAAAVERHGATNGNGASAEAPVKAAKPS